jgi:hypothetical protein
MLPAFIGRIVGHARPRHLPPGVIDLDLEALKDAQLAGSSSSAPGPFLEFGNPEPIIIDSDDRIGALLHHIDKAFRGGHSNPSPSRRWWDDLAKLAAGVRR